MRLAAPVALALLLACTPDTALPPDVQLTCADGAPCPEGFTCNATLGRCLQVDALDTVPPKLTGGGLALTRTLLRQGGVTRVSVEVDEALGLTPAATLELPAGARPLTLDAAASAGARYAFTYAAVGDEPQDVDVPVTVLLTDRGGNQARFSTPVRFDFTPPDVSAPQVTGSPARAGGVYRVTFTVNELPEGAPQVRRGSAALALDADASAHPTYVFTGTAAGDEPARDALELTVADRAGNVRTRRFEDALAFDFAPPALAAAEVLTPEVRAGFTAIVRLEASEPLAAPPTVQLVPAAAGPALPMSVAEQVGTAYTFVRRVAAADADGLYAVQVAGLADAAGNAGAAGSAGTLRLDTTAPALVVGPTPDRFPAAYNAGSTVTLDFEVSEPLPAAPAVTLAAQTPRAFACAAAGGGAGRWSCTLALDGTERPEGPVGVSVVLGDAAGNVGFGSATVTLDFTAPAVVAGSEQLWLVPAAGNPVRAPTAVATGTTVQLSFGLTEPVVGDPAVTTTGPAELPFTRAAGGGLFYTLTLGGGAQAQGPHGVRVVARDAAGNAGTSTLALPAPGLVVDTLPPAAPDVASAGAVLYRRVPWGAEETGGAREFTLEATAGALPPDTSLRALDGAAPASAAELGRAPADGTGAVARFALSRTDRPVVWAQALDAAGNGSAAVEVRDVEWVATLGGKRPGSVLENPTRLVTTPRFLPFQQQDVQDALEPTAAQLAQLVARDAVGLTVAGAQGWRAGALSTQVPSARSWTALATDTARGKVVMFGAQGSQAPGDETWELDLATRTWQRRFPVGAVPPARYAHMLAYDARHGTVVLFGGVDTNGATLQDTWEWDGETGTWTERALAPAARPPIRSAGQMAYDLRRGRTVLFSGEPSPYGNINREVWEWDGEAWTNVTPSPLPAVWPVGRSGAAFVYEPARGVFVLHGGVRPVTGGAAVVNETWEYEPVTRTWADRSAVAGAPPASNGGLGFWDAARGAVALVLSVQDSQSGLTSTQAWEWRGAGAGGWTARTPSPSPRDWLPGRWQLAGAPDPLTGGLLVFGGMRADGGYGALDETWLYRGGSLNLFSRVGASGTPVGTMWNAAAYDTARQRTVLFGGRTGTGSDPREVWEYDAAGDRWTNVTPASLPTPWPTARSGHAMAYDSARRRIYVFGGSVAGSGNVNELWSYAPETRAWTNHTPGVLPALWPQPLFGAMAAYDAQRDVLVVYGGGGGSCDPCGDLWEWSPASGTWARPARTAGWPHATSQGVLVYDSDRRRTVLFGGQAWSGSGGVYYSDQLWDWTGSAWVSRTRTDTAQPWPRGRFQTQAAYDAARRRVVLFGGWCADCAAPSQADVWELDVSGTTGPASARAVPVAGSPVPGRSKAFFTYDPTLRLGVTFSGDQAAGTPSDTWRWSAGSASRPGAVWTVPFAAAENAGPVVVERVTVRAAAGGLGATEGASVTAVPGATLQAWSAAAGGWVDLADANAALPGSGGAAATWDVAVTDAARLGDLFSGPQQSVVLGLSARAPLGGAAAPAQLWVDGLELRVRYRRN